MSEATYLYDEPYRPNEIWDPQLGRNVYIGGANPLEYLQANPSHYQDYTGAVATKGRTPLHVSAFTGIQPTAPKADVYRQAYERSQILNRPKRWALDPVEQGLMQLAITHNIPFPTLKSLTWDKGHNPAEAFTNRGFRYGGTPSPEEQQLTEAALAGEPVDLNRLAALRSQRIEAVPLSPIQKFGNQIYGPLIMTAGPAILTAGMAAAALPAWETAAAGGAAGAFAAGTASRWEDPTAVLAGAAGGALGGYGAGMGAQALGAGPVVTGAASGAGGGAGSAVGRGAAHGEINPGDILRGAAMGAAAGVLNRTTSLPPALASPIVNYGANAIWPRPQRKRNPYA